MVRSDERLNAMLYDECGSTFAGFIVGHAHCANEKRCYLVGVIVSLECHAESGFEWRDD